MLLLALFKNTPVQHLLPAVHTSSVDMLDFRPDHRQFVLELNSRARLVPYGLHLADEASKYFRLFDLCRSWGVHDK